MPLLALAFLAFIGLGLPDPLPGSLWPELRPQFGVANAGLGLVLAATAMGYAVAGLLVGRLVQAMGVGGVVVASLGATAAAILGQALAPPWPVFVALAVLCGMGGGAVDAALNAFAAKRFQPRHMNWLHGCWGIGATLGPAGAAALLAAGFGWQAGYAAVAAVLAALTIGFWATRRRWADDARPGTPHGSIGAVLRHTVARQQLAIFFLYTGLEAGTGQWAATVLTEGRGATPAQGALAATVFFAALTAGRIGFGFVVDRIGPDRLLRLLAPLTVAAALALGSGQADLVALAGMALAMAPTYPTLMARTPARVGSPLALHAVGLQVVVATLGVATVPAALGLAADLWTAAALPWLLAGLAGVVAVLIRRLPRSGTAVRR